MEMDPALWELVETGSPEDEVSVILRLAPGADPPVTVRVVSRFEIFRVIVSAISGRVLAVTATA